LYFDTRRNGEQFIDALRPALWALRQTDGVSDVRCLRLEEECQTETRGELESSTG
jgi:hypothetical protein